MKHGPMSYHSLGRVHPRDGLRVFYGRRSRKTPIASAVASTSAPTLVPDKRYPVGVTTTTITIIGKPFG